MPEPIDLLIEGTVVTMDADRRVFRDGAVAVRGGRIVAVDEAAELRERYEPERRTSTASTSPARWRWTRRTLK